MFESQSMATIESTILPRVRSKEPESYKKASTAFNSQR
jgi:hypothetical protein